MSKCALLISIGYCNTKEELPGSLTAMNYWTEILKKRGYTTTLIHDDVSIKPTKDNIVTEMVDIILSNNTDIMILFIAHGLEAGILPLDHETNGVIDDTLLQSMLQTTRSNQNVFMIIESCYSDRQLLRYKHHNSRFVTRSKPFYVPGNVIVFSSSGYDQISQIGVSNEIFIGVFSSAILHVIYTTENITYYDLFITIKKLIRKCNDVQIPTLACSNIDLVNREVWR